MKACVLSSESCLDTAHLLAFDLKRELQVGGCSRHDQFIVDMVVGFAVGASFLLEVLSADTSQVRMQDTANVDLRSRVGRSYRGS